MPDPLWDEFVDSLRTLPDLPGARCRGRWELYDQTTRTGRGADNETLRYAQRAALRLCEQCPVLDRCAAWLASLPPAQRPPGVVAGQIVTSTPGKGVRIATAALPGDRLGRRTFARSTSEQFSPGGRGKRPPERITI